MRKVTLRRWLNTATGVLLIGFMLFPVYWMVNASMQPTGSLVDASWFPLEPDLGGYRDALAEQGRYLLNSLLVSAGSVLVSLLVAAPAAYGLAQLRLRFTGAVLVGVLVTQMIPGIVVANALFSAYNQLGLLNTYAGLILADSTAGIPFAILLLRAFMQRLPRELIEAASLDGASRFRTFRSVVVPVSRNAIVTAGLFTFLFTWSDFLFALTLTTTDAMRPVTLGIYRYIGADTTQWNSIMATAVLASIPAAVMLISAQRYISAGATAGAVK